MLRALCEGDKIEGGRLGGRFESELLLFLCIKWGENLDTLLFRPDFLAQQRRLKRRVQKRGWFEQVEWTSTAALSTGKRPEVSANPDEEYSV